MKTILVIGAGNVTKADDGQKAASGDDTADVSEAPEVSMPLTVARWSSQSDAASAVRLQDVAAITGRWETAIRRCKNEFLVVEFESLGHMTAIEFGLADMTAAPRRCRMQCCQRSPSGPWHDVWRFQVAQPSNSTLVDKSESNHGSCLK